MEGDTIQVEFCNGKIVRGYEQATRWFGEMAVSSSSIVLRSDFKKLIVFKEKNVFLSQTSPRMMLIERIR